MNDLATFWFNEKTPKSYHEIINKLPSGLIDEKIIEDFINKYTPDRKKIIVDLGIGTGRELVWLDKTLNIKRIIGVDYSTPMLEFLEKEKVKYKHTIETVNDDLLNLSNLPTIIEKEKQPIVYISLINSLGNFSLRERLIVLKNIKSIMKNEDRLVIALYKITQHAKLNNLVKNSPRLKTNNPQNQTLIAEIIEYGLLPFFWTSVMEKYHTLPRFWYDKENHNIVIHIDGKRLLVSHRFSKEEIEEEFEKSGVKVEKIIEGKTMWIVVGKR